jgi:hypothetical protein
MGETDPRPITEGVNTGKGDRLQTAAPAGNDGLGLAGIEAARHEHCSRVGNYNARQDVPLHKTRAAPVSRYPRWGINGTGAACFFYWDAERQIESRSYG